MVVSEGIRDCHGKFVSESGLRDSFGHAQLGGVAPVLAELVKTNLQLKYHWAVADYLQRAARHSASAVDVEQAYALGKSAVDLALSGKNAVMPIIVREQDHPYIWSIGHVHLSEVANQEKTMPAEFIREDGMGITPACRSYLLPLIAGELPPPYVNGLPDYVRLKNHKVKRKLDKWLGGIEPAKFLVYRSKSNHR